MGEDKLKELEKYLRDELKCQKDINKRRHKSICQKHSLMKLIILVVHSLQV